MFSYGTKHKSALFTMRLRKKNGFKKNSKELKMNTSNGLTRFIIKISKILQKMERVRCFAVFEIVQRIKKQKKKH